MIYGAPEGAPWYNPPRNVADSRSLRRASADL